ncbi:MAG: glycine--tRNA ligase subunit beta, partial [Eggerthellaceae bacterium]|nr:glycine--tRNA ligase subunit beta [Eggerthellaceae bacterium]
MTETRTLAFEIGTEEIPAFDLANASQQLDTLARKAFDAARIGFEGIEVYSTPRRLIVIASGVATMTEALVEEYKGPACTLAFDEAGQATKAAIGFAKGKGVDVGDLSRRMVAGTEYVYAIKEVAACDVAGLLPSLLKGLIEDIAWPKSCRWGTQTVLFSRPVRWLLALFGDQVVPVAFGGLVAENTTQGHRFLASGSHLVACADDL